MSKLVRTLLGIIILVSIVSSGADLGIFAFLFGLFIAAQLLFD